MFYNKIDSSKTIDTTEIKCRACVNDGNLLLGENVNNILYINTFKNGGYSKSLLLKFTKSVNKNNIYRHDLITNVIVSSTIPRIINS